MRADWFIAVVSLAAYAGADDNPPSHFQAYRLRCAGSNLLARNPSASFSIDNRTPRFTWAAAHAERGERQTAYRIVIKHHRRGANFDSLDVAFDSGRVLSADPSHQCDGAAGGCTLQSDAFYVWSVTLWDSAARSSLAAAPAKFHMALDAPDWNGVGWVTGNAKQNHNMLRATFNLDADPASVQSAVIYVCGLSYSFVRMNGAPASPGLLTTSPWTNNEKRNGYSSLDVTRLLKQGVNAVGVVLGHGWRDQRPDSEHGGEPVFKRKDPDFAADPAAERILRLQLRLQHTNGSSSTALHTGDGSWQAGSGPYVDDATYNGESYDARQEQPGWDVAEFDAGSGWEAAVPTAGPPGAMRAWSAPAVQEDRSIKPASIAVVDSPSPSTSPIFVVDFGVNVAGVCRLRNIKVRAGANVTLRHAEILQHAGLPDLNGTVLPGRIYVGNLRGARATDVYTARGDEAGELYQPMLTYHGFRFVEVSSTDPSFKLGTDDIELVHLHSALAQRAVVHFNNSDTLNMIQRLAVGAQRSNLMTVPTDCDQRDERLGWTGDADLSSDSMCLNFDCGPFMSSFAATMADEMGDSSNPPDGSLTEVAPYVRFGVPRDKTDASWAAAFIQMAHVVYKEEGDLSLARQYYPLFLRQLNVMLQRTAAAGSIGSLQTPHGDWCPPPTKPGGTPDPRRPQSAQQGPKPTPSLTSAFSYIIMVQEVAELADAMGNSTEHDRLSKLALHLMAEFNEAFFHHANGTYDLGLQTGYSLALQLLTGEGIPPTDAAPYVNASLHRLQEAVAAEKNHHNTGIIGFKFLFDGLKAGGHEATALAVLEQTDYPSVGHCFANLLEPASENLWELMDAFVEGVGMNSRNHHMWSSYSHYLISDLAGISQHKRAGGWGYKHLNFLPASSGLGLSHARASLALPVGRVVHEWRRHGGVQCAKASEGRPLRLDCGAAGGSIVSVEFASFGAPAGACGAFKLAPAVPASCHAPATASVLAALCVGKPSCEVAADAATFLQEETEVNAFREHSCAGVLDRLGASAWLWAQVRCSAPPALQVHVEVPLASSADVQFPYESVFNSVEGAPAAEHGPRGVLITERSTDAVLFGREDGSYGDGAKHFASPVAAVATKDHAGRGVVVLSVGSGRYDLLMTKKTKKKQTQYS